MSRAHVKVRKTGEPVRITTAAAGRNADIANRQRKYVISMAIRAACFVGAVIAGMAGITWLWPILIAGAVILPYVAVVFANATDTRGETFRLEDSPFGTHAELPPGRSED